jgi:hypothetical protein
VNVHALIAGGRVILPVKAVTPAAVAMKNRPAPPGAGRRTPEGADRTHHSGVSGSLVRCLE